MRHNSCSQSLVFLPRFRQPHAVILDGECDDSVSFGEVDPDALCFAVSDGIADSFLGNAGKGASSRPPPGSIPADSQSKTQLILETLVTLFASSSNAAISPSASISTG